LCLMHSLWDSKGASISPGPQGGRFERRGRVAQ
jgi:hypothetical protein